MVLSEKAISALALQELPKLKHIHLTGYNTAKATLIQNQCLPVMAFSGDSSTTPVSQPGSDDLEKQQTPGEQLLSTLSPINIAWVCLTLAV